MARVYVESFRGLPRQVWFVALGLLITRAGMMVLPFLSLYLVSERGLTSAQAGRVLLAFGLGSLAGSWLGGGLADRWGTLRVQVSSLVGAGLAFFLFPLLGSPWALAVGAFVLNAINDAYRPACMAAAAEHAPAGFRIRALALVRLAANLGIAIGPALGGVLAAIDYRLLFVGDGLTCWLAAGALMLALGGEGARAGRGVTAGPSRRAHRDGRFLTLLAIVFVLALALFQLFGTVPLHLKRGAGLPEGQIGALFALNALLIVLFEMVLVRWLERRDAALLLGFGGLLMCASFALLALNPGPGAAVAMFVLLTIGEMLSLPFSNGLVASLAGEGRAGEYMGWYSVTFALAFMISPLLGLWLLDLVGPRSLYLAIAALGLPVCAASVALSRWLYRRPASSRTNAA